MVIFQIVSAGPTLGTFATTTESASGTVDIISDTGVAPWDTIRVTVTVTSSKGTTESPTLTSTTVKGVDAFGTNYGESDTTTAGLGSIPRLTTTTAALEITVANTDTETITLPWYATVEVTETSAKETWETTTSERDFTTLIRSIDTTTRSTVGLTTQESVENGLSVGFVFVGQPGETILVGSEASLNYVTDFSTTATQTSVTVDIETFTDSVPAFASGASLPQITFSGSASGSRKELVYTSSVEVSFTEWNRGICPRTSTSGVESRNVLTTTLITTPSGSSSTARRTKSGTSRSTETVSEASYLYDGGDWASMAYDGPRSIESVTKTTVSNNQVLITVTSSGYTKGLSKEIVSTLSEGFLTAARSFVGAEAVVARIESTFGWRKPGSAFTESQLYGELTGPPSSFLLDSSLLFGEVVPGQSVLVPFEYSTFVALLITGDESAPALASISLSQNLEGEATWTVVTDTSTSTTEEWTWDVMGEKTEATTTALLGAGVFGQPFSEDSAAGIRATAGEVHLLITMAGILYRYDDSGGSSSQKLTGPSEIATTLSRPQRFEFYPASANGPVVARVTPRRNTAWWDEMGLVSSTFF